MSCIIPKNSIMPAKGTKPYITIEDNQESVRFSVYEGECKEVSGNNLLGCLKLTEVPPLPKGDAKLTVTFAVNANGILVVHATVDATGKTVVATIKNEAGRLTAAEVEEMRLEAARYGGPVLVSVGSKSQTRLSVGCSL
jgi:molecular chaperone DnaK (HSP70)